MPLIVRDVDVFLDVNIEVCLAIVVVLVRNGMTLAVDAGSPYVVKKRYFWIALGDHCIGYGNLVM